MTRNEKIEYDRQYRKDKRDQLRVYEKSRSSRPERQRDPIRLRARYALRNAVKAGRLSKPYECADCGKVDTELHGHHEDYLKPLDVCWLCSTCHGERHRIKI